MAKFREFIRDRVRYGAYFSDGVDYFSLNRHTFLHNQVLIRFALQRNMVVIPKSVTESRIKENFQVFDFALSKEDMDAIMAFDRPDGRALLLEWCNHLPHYPFNIPF